MRLRNGLPVGLLGRLLGILLLTLAIEFVASTILYEQSSRSLIRQDEARRLAEHLVIARKLLSDQDPAARPALASRLTTDRYDIHWAGSTVIQPARPAERGQAYHRVLDWETSLADSDLRVQTVAAGRRAQLFGALRLNDGTWMRFRALEPEEGDQPGWHRILLVLVPATAMLILGALLFRHTLRPMRMLARAADRIGRSSGMILPEAGPTEVRHVIHAFNAMQTRIQQLITDRTEALAAVGHDLRTPLSRLQLRAELVADPVLRRAFEGDLAEMDAMVSSLLAFLSGDEDPETPTRTDVAVMAATIVDDAADRGDDAIYVGSDHLEAIVRPSGLKRAIGNLVQNALQYGHRAQVGTRADGSTLLIWVEDEGPGIPEDQMEQVLHPFTRLDPARGRNTKGLGLGLAIVMRLAAIEGGTLNLSNRPGGGLRAELRLPLR